MAGYPSLTGIDRRVKELRDWLSDYWTREAGRKFSDIGSGNAADNSFCRIAISFSPDYRITLDKMVASSEALGPVLHQPVELTLDRGCLTLEYYLSIGDALRHQRFTEQLNGARTSFAPDKRKAPPDF